METVSLTTPPPAQSPKFNGTKKDLFWLLLKNAGLSLVTFGIYRFWARTNLRRFYWNNTTVGNDAVEYLGTGKELFIGFLIVIAVLLPLFTIYNVAAAWAQNYGFGAWLTIQALYLITLGLLIPAAIHRAWRYRLNRTAWRGVRFSLGGSTWRFIGKALAWYCASLFTLFLLFPLLRLNLGRYLLGNIKYGTLSTSWKPAKGATRSLLLAWLPSWLLMLLIITGYAFFVVQVIILAQLTEQSQSATPAILELLQQNISQFLPTILIIFVLLLASAIAYVFYRVREFHLFAGMVTFPPITFASLARSAAIFKAYAWGLLIILTEVVVMIGLGYVIFQLVPAHEPAIPVMIVTIVFLPVHFLVMTALHLAVTFTIIRHFLESLEVHNLDQLPKTEQSPEAAITRAEGLADTFDMGAI